MFIVGGGNYTEYQNLKDYCKVCHGPTASIIMTEIECIVTFGDYSSIILIQYGCDNNVIIHFREIKAPNRLSME